MSRNSYRVSDQIDMIRMMYANKRYRELGELYEEFIRGKDRCITVKCLIILGSIVACILVMLFLSASWSGSVVGYSSRGDNILAGIISLPFIVTLFIYGLFMWTMIRKGRKNVERSVYFSMCKELVEANDDFDKVEESIFKRFK